MTDFNKNWKAHLLEQDFDKSKLLQVLKKGDEFNGKTIKNVYIRRLFEDDIEIYLELRNGL